MANVVEYFKQGLQGGLHNYFDLQECQPYDVLKCMLELRF